MIGRYQVKDLDEMLPTIPFSSAEVEAKAITKEMWNDSSRARPVAQSVGGRSKVLEVRAMPVQHKSNQILLKVHKTPGEENEADVWTKFVPQADLDKMRNSVGYLNTRGA